jgi:hypothetical protein
MYENVGQQCNILSSEDLEMTTITIVGIGQQDNWQQGSLSLTGIILRMEIYFKM